MLDKSTKKKMGRMCKIAIRNAGMKQDDISRVFQSSRKRRITRIGTHVFSLGRMIFASRESRVRMFF